MKIFKILLVCGLWILTSSSAFASDMEAGKKLVDQVCAACHGADGNSELPANPKLAGQYKSYLIKALTDYRSGKRQNPIMAGFAASLSDEDIENVSAYFADQSGDLSTLKP